MSLKEEIEKNESIFSEDPTIKYYFKSATNPDSEFLLIGFSGFNGKESSGEPPKYNYIKYLKSIDLNQLYIIDSNSDNIPLYYLGEGNLDYQDKVIQLILDIANKKNIPLKNIITFGSSKGGTAAAFFAMKYSLGNFVSGGMQTKAGDYLYSLGGFSRNKIIPIISNENPEIGREKINKQLMSVFNNPIQNTNYFLHGGKEDSHFLNYVKPFTEVLEKKGINYDLNLADYKDHGEIGQYFSKYLCRKISEIVSIPIIEKVTQKVSNNILMINIHLYSNHINPVYSVYLFKEGDTTPVKKIPYQKANIFKINNLIKGKYRARVYCKYNEYVTKVNTGYIEL